MSGIEVAAWLGKALSAGAEKVITGSGVAAVGRLIGASADVPTAFMENIAQSIRDKGQARSQISKAIADSLSVRASGDPQIMERALNSMLQREYRVQINKDAVAKAAVEALLETPPNEDLGGPSEQFMTMFERHAETATTDELRVMFGRLLAGEIRKPGMVSPAAMHFVSMLDEDSANLVRRALPCCGQGVAYLDAIQPKLNVAEISFLEQAGFWSADKRLPVKFDSAGYLFRFPRENEGFICVAPPNHTVSLSVALLSSGAKTLMDATQVSFNYGQMADLLFANGATWFRAGQIYKDGDEVGVRDDILVRHSDPVERNRE